MGIKFNPFTGKFDLTGSGGATPGGSDGQVQFNDNGAFGAVEELTYDPATGSLVFNDGGLASADLRLESDTLANIFFLDSSADRIGINTLSPGALIGINGTLRIQDDAHSKSFDLIQDEFQSRIKANTTGWVLEGANFSDITLEPSGGNGNGKLSVNSNLSVEGKSNGSGESVINESGSDSNFRVEGDTDQNAFFVDAGTDRVGIGTASPKIGRAHV